MKKGIASGQTSRIAAVLPSKKWDAVGKVRWVVICFLNFVLLNVFTHLFVFSDAHLYLLQYNKKIVS